MVTRFKQQMNMPYSLHDMVVSNITCQNGTVYLEFEHGFVSAKEPYGKCCFEIVDEMYGFHQVEYIGYLRLPKDNELDLIQMSLSMYFNGDIVYETEE